MKKLFVLLIVALLLSNVLEAQQNEKQSFISKSSVKNLVKAINSDNTGLKRSAVYFAGYYKISESIDPLVNLINSSSSDKSLKTLAAYSIYQIGSTKCINALKKASNIVNDRELSIKCKLMYEDLQKNNAEFIYQ